MKKQFLMILPIVILLLPSVISLCCIEDGKCHSVSSRAECGGEFFPHTDCYYVSDCRPGTCIVDGECLRNYPKIECKSIGGTWKSDVPSNIPECKKGCCRLANECFLATETKCNNLGGEYDGSITDTIECLKSCGDIIKGCCITSEGCKYTTFTECQDLGGNFNEDLCVNVPECGCVKNTTACDGNTLIWMDSCGNYAGVVEDCGENICAKDVFDDDNDGDTEEYICMEIKCRTFDNPIIDYDGDVKIGGESWCEPLQFVKSALRLPGTIYYVHRCTSEGEIAEACITTDNEICTPMTTNVGDREILYSRCVPIREWGSCYEQTTKEACEDKSQRDCVWIGGGGGKCEDKSEGELSEECKKELASKGFHFPCDHFTSQKECEEQCYCKWVVEEGEGVGCVPASPPRVNDPGVCNLAYYGLNAKGYMEDNAFPTYWELIKEPMFGERDWECETDEIYEDDDLQKGMNFICMAAGDCGASVNFVGKFSNAGYWKDCGAKPHCCDKESMDCEYTISYNFWERYFGNDPNWNVGISVDSVEDVIEKVEKVKSDFITQVVSTLITPEGALGTIFSLAGMGAMIGSAFGPLGSAIGAAIGAAVGTFAWLMTETFGGVVDAEVVYVEFKCKPWEPPDTRDCWRCNKPYSEGGILPDHNGKVIEGYTCTEYQCKALGKFCQLTTDGTCIYAEPGLIPLGIKVDVNGLSSQIKCCTSGSQERECQQKRCSVKDNGINVGYEIEDYVYEQEIVNLTFKTFNIDTGEDVYADCYYTETFSQNFDITNMDYLDSGVEHVIQVPVHYRQGNDNKMHYWVKCKPSIETQQGEAPPYPLAYKIEFEFHKGPDHTPPAIEGFIPDSGSFISADTKNVTVKLYISEIISYNSVLDSYGSCRWAKEDVPFEEMPKENEIRGSMCYTRGGAYQICKVTLPIDSEGENKFYFACNDTSGNIGETVEYTLIKTPPLNITEFYPSSTECYLQDGEINCYTYNITLRAVTQAGALNGQANCSYGKSETNIIDQFYQTGGTEHVQPELYFFAPGRYTYYAICQDIAGNKAVKSVTFNIRIDRNPPEVKEVKKEQGNLVLTISDEIPQSVKCEYAHKPFIAGNGTAMHSDMQGHFYAGYKENSIYYIKCYDKFGNAMKTLKVLT